MRVLLDDRNRTHYLAKCHEALRTGLDAHVDLTCYGPGYPRHNRLHEKLCGGSYPRLIQSLYGRRKPDLLVTLYDYERKRLAFNRTGLADAGVPTAILLCDYWGMAAKHRDRFVDIVQDNGIDLVLSYFPQPRDIWADTPIADRIYWLPTTFDPKLFRDWSGSLAAGAHEDKPYDVGFLAAGTVTREACYPERFEIHQQLAQRTDLRYLYAQHPGWGEHRRRHPLVGKGFSQAIGGCRLFVTTGGIHRNPQPKLFEALASGTVVMSDEPVGADALGLVDGETYVRITPQNVQDKIDHYLARPDQCREIAERGYALAMEQHHCYARAAQMLQVIRSREHVFQHQTTLAATRSAAA